MLLAVEVLGEWRGRNGCIPNRHVNEPSVAKGKRYG